MQSESIFPQQRGHFGGHSAPHRSQTILRPPMRINGSLDTSAPLDKWIEVEEPLQYVQPEKSDHEDPVLAEVIFYRRRRDNYCDGFLVDRDKDGRIQKRATESRYAFRDTKQRIERDARLIRERREVKRKETEVIVARQMQEWASLLPKSSGEQAVQKTVTKKPARTKHAQRQRSSQRQVEVRQRRRACLESTEKPRSKPTRTRKRQGD